MNHLAKVAVIGFGTVGSGVAKLLQEQAPRLARRMGKQLVLAHVVDSDPKRLKSDILPPNILSTTVKPVLEDRETTLAIESLDDPEQAREIVLQLLEHGKDVVTANKLLLAEHGTELFERARELGRAISFGAAVAGGVPIVPAIAECLAANQIESIHAILNGTCNFILTQMEEHESEYASALAEAQQRGYADPNPIMDTGGHDAAQKLAILAQVAFGVRVPWRNIPRVGIDIVDLMDVHFAKELGYRIKLLAVAESLPDGLELHVSPTLVRRGMPLAEVSGVYNAVRIVGSAVGRVFFHGLGSGQMPIASAVLADAINTITGRAALTFPTLNLWPVEGETPLRLRDFAESSSRYYLRLNVEDRPGVIAEISGILSRHGISIASVIQHETEEESSNVVPLVIMTHVAQEGKMAAAMKLINQLSCVQTKGVRLRVRN